MQSLAPKGLSYTNFGPGMSMGHSVCVRSKAGVKNALSMTIPLGEGIHRRMVYVELEEGAKLEEVAAAIKADPYFASDETHVFQVESVDDVRDMGHGVNLVRKGVSGKTQNQRLEFNMSINNPALTGQVLVNVSYLDFATFSTSTPRMPCELMFCPVCNTLGTFVRWGTLQATPIDTSFATPYIEPPSVPV